MKELAEDAQAEKGGYFIGPLETVIFFSAEALPQAWTLGFAWLAFKVILYCESQNLTKMPEKLPKEDSDIYERMGMPRLGEYYSSRLLIGTAWNIFAALAGVALSNVAADQWPAGMLFLGISPS